MPGRAPDSVTVAEGGREEVARSVAIIMDGNGRWAEARSLPRIAGHREGSESVRAVTREARELGIEALTLYAFSAQNWARPPGGRPRGGARGSPPSGRSRP